MHVPNRKEYLSKEGFDATQGALDQVTTDAGDHAADPKKTLHKPADHQVSHSWLSKVLPASTLSE